MFGGEEDQPGGGGHAFGLDLGEELVSGDHHAVHVGYSTACRHQQGDLKSSVVALVEHKQRGYLTVAEAHRI